MSFLSFIFGLSFVAQAEPSWPDISEPISNIGVNMGEDSALIIAIEDYTYAPDVAGALQNGKDWEQYFIDSAGIPLSQVRFLSNELAYKDAILEVAQELSEKTHETGKIWLVYIGHGANYENKPIILDVDARQTDISFKKSLLQEELLSVLEQQHDVIALIDACFSGRDTQGLALLTGSQPVVLSSMLEMPKTTILTAATSDQFAGDLPYLSRPSFSYLALGALRGWGDLNNDGQISLLEVKNYSEEAIASVVVGRRQTPTITGSNENQIVSKGREKSPDLQVYRTQKILKNTSKVVSVSAVVNGGDFSLDDIEDVQTLSAQIELIKIDLDKGEKEIREKAKQDWNNEAFVSLRTSAPELVMEKVERFVEAYSNVVVKYSQKVSFPVEVSLSRKVDIPEVEKAEIWFLEHRKVNHFEGEYYQPVLIPKGIFMMGWTEEEGGIPHISEVPSHKVEITKDFYLMEAEVTQALYRQIMGNNPSHFKGGTHPVENVEWYDAVKFANGLSQREGFELCYSIEFFEGDNLESERYDVMWNNKNCNGWRLPTEAEWEYAARGGQAFKYSGSDGLSSVAWYKWTSKEETHPVCSKQKNGFGLCDMSGNVKEWVWDNYSLVYETHAAQGMVQDPIGPSQFPQRILRGGSFRDEDSGCQVSARTSLYPDSPSYNRGFRLARTP